MSVTKPLPEQINETHRCARESAANAVEWAVKCGHMLIALKEASAHGEFENNVRKTEVPLSTARLYMRAARENANALAFSSLRNLFPSGRQRANSPKVAGSPIDTPEIVATGLRDIPPELRIAVEPGCVTAALIDGQPAIAVAESQRNRGFWYVCDLRDRTYNTRPILGAAVGLLVAQIAGWNRAEWHMSEQQDWFPEAA